MRGGLGTIEGNLNFGILRRTQGIERIRVMMGNQSLWILSDLVEIGNSGIRLLDLGEIWFGSLEEIWDFFMDFFIEILLVLVKQGLWIIMGQLVGKGGDMVNGEMARKRLNISVPHFDNSDFIKSYDMTLVGRCMNPEAHKVDALLVMLPKFWKVEERMRVVLDSTKELCFETEVDFKGGEFYEEEEVLVLLKYDKLFGFCKRCFNLCHDEDHCPLNPRSPSKKKETKEIEERKEERARSYKGVRPSSYRANARGEEERSRPCNPRWEQSRYPMQEDRNRYQRGVRREQEGPKEEGEITVTERRQRNLHKVENIGEKAASAEIENLVTGLEQGMDLVGVGKGVADSEPLEFDGTVTLADHKEELLGGDDEFQALTDGEVEETNKLDEVTRGGAEGEEEIGGNGGTYDQMGEEARKKGARTSKMRLVQAVLSPRKTGASKSTKRQGGGEGAKHTEEKGPSHPKNPKKPDEFSVTEVCIWMQSEARQEECTLDHGAMSQVTWDVSSPGLLGGLIKPQTASMLFRQEWFWCSRERCIYSYIVA
ncbi:hypothetical protein Bca52824_064458 [Brassica carinata]|uniref:DUF4283 domain-containing protein n=1 Tax=Brassica carinata TaxID=52824 RepID=A0A8X7QHJ2_BRACI|nr:hypothetical protein Bca52824_064458 [Brassica carinata]